MGAFWLCVGVAILAFCFGVLGLHLHKILPEDHASNSRDMIGAIVGLVSLLLALVLGTLVGSSYAFYSTQKSEIETLASRVIQLDLALAGYGPDTMVARQAMKTTFQGVRNDVWGSAEPKADLSVAEPLPHLKLMDEYLASLDPKNSGAEAVRRSVRRRRGDHRADADPHLASACESDLLASRRDRDIVGADPFLRLRLPVAHHADEHRRAGARRLRGRQRALPHSRTEPAVQRPFPRALRRVRPDADGAREIRSAVANISCQGKVEMIAAGCSKGS